MAQTFGYPARVEADEAGFWLVTFPDIPEAGTDARDREEAVREAGDAVVAALGGYIAAHRALPLPSTPAPGQPVVHPPPLAAAKLALYRAMRDEAVSEAELAGQLGMPVAAVRDLLDLDHRSHIGEVEAALAALGRRLVVGVDAA